ncbi:MAG TPA: response regulator [Holophagaceae bacterium]|nr:response regulator [Holophagaceae bacterium]
MERFFSLATVLAYAALTALWGTILVLYVRLRRRARAMDALVAVLAAVLALDAFKSFVESLYFGLLWGSNYGVLPQSFGRILSDPAGLFLPKALNLGVACTVIFILIRRWIPRELAERKALQEDLASAYTETRQSEAQLRRLLDALAELALTLSLEDGRPRIRSANGPLLAAFGLPPRLQDEAGLETALPGSLIAALGAAAVRARSLGVVPLELEVDLSLGPRTFQFLVVPLGGEGEMGIFAAVGRDLTEERKAQLVRQESQKLESLGLLAGGVAHDFNNLLTAMLGNLNLAQVRLPADSGAQTHLANLESTVVRASELTRQLLAYSGKGHFVVKSVDLSRAVREIGHLLSVTIPKRIHVAYQLEEGLPPVEADPAQLQQVVMNLVTNAAEAIGDREGAIRIATGTQTLDERYILTTFPGQPIGPGDYVTLEVSDDGQGMTPEVLSRIFDPFFSTKASGRGLGLSAMLGILRGHRGGLKVYTEPGGGSSFKLFFPASDVAPDEAAAEQAPAPGRRFSGLALVVDDEPLIREAAAEMLQLLGFETLQASDGEEALAELAKRPEAFQLVLMDLTMPGMDGREAFRHMKLRRPDLRVILSSGYSEQEAIQAFRGKGLAGFIQKPYRMADLGEAVARAMAPGFIPS